MNVARNRRRLLQGRRYSRRYRAKVTVTKLVPVTAGGISWLDIVETKDYPATPPIWSHVTTRFDSDSVLRAVRRLAMLKYTNAKRLAIANFDLNDFCVVGPPCGGCGNCMYAQDLHCASSHRDDSMVARIRLHRRIDPRGMQYIADLGHDD